MIRHNRSHVTRVFYSDPKTARRVPWLWVQMLQSRFIGVALIKVYYRSQAHDPLQ